MRYIGNKTRLLGFIGRVLDEHGLRSGHAFDAFSGTASVGSFLKKRGFAVSSCDLMTYSFVLQKARIEADAEPSFERVREHDPELRRARVGGRSRSPLELALSPPSPAHDVFRYLESELPSLTAFITRQFAPDGSGDEPGDRMFFTRENAQRIDAIRTCIHEWRIAGLLDDPEYFVLLAALIEGADAVANTTGVYAAFVKSWQPNALRPLRLRYPDVVPGTGSRCAAYQGNAGSILGEIGPVDILYMDPPYNTRQYSGYYHVPELLARGWFDGEPELRGKTGLMPDGDLRSAWSTRGGCVDALADLLSRANARCALMSYNSEGIIPEPEINRLFREHDRGATFRLHELDYARYRADADHAGRRYKGDHVRERLYYVECNGHRS